MRAFRATLRPIRVELIAITGLLATLVAAGVLVAARLAAFGLPFACLDFSSVDPACAGRQSEVAAYQAFAESFIPPLRFFSTLVAPLAGVILGIALVGKELDQRTTVLAWSLGPSRRRWLLQRLVPVAVFVALIGLAAPQFADALNRLAQTGSVIGSIGDTQPEFFRIPSTGFSPALMGLSAFGMTVMIGAMLGRLLPALLVALVFIVGSTLVIEQGNHWLMSRETLVADQAHVGPGEQVDSLLQVPDGRILRWDEAYAEFADPETGELTTTFTELIRYAPIEIYPQVAARFLLFHGVLALVALTLAFAVVERRTP